MHSNLVRLTLLLLFLSTFPGCTDRPRTPETPEGPWETWEPRFGLGLDTSFIPPPGPFRENASDLDRLANWLNATGRARLLECGVRNLSGFESLMHDRYYLPVVDMIYQNCAGDNTGHQLEAQRDHAEGRAEQKMRDLMAKAHDHLNASAQAINSVAWPANAVDLQVLGRLMRWVIWMDAAYQTTPALAEQYFETNDGNLVAGAYLNLYIPSDGRASIEWLVSHYPWSPVACSADPAKVHLLRVEAWTLLNATIAKAERLRPPDEDPNLSTNYGRLTQDFRPAMEFSDAHGWWPATLWYEYLVNSSSSYWDHRYDSVLPNNDEAGYLLASYLNESRTLISDDEIAILQGNIPYWDYADYPIWPTLVLATSHQAAPWTYDDLPCGTGD